MNPPRVYLDNAATSWPKRAVVFEAMDDYARHCGVAAGRGTYRRAGQAAGIVSQLRREIAEMISAPTAESISLHASGTAALNAAIQGFLQAGDHVVTTAAEHNSVLRPLHWLQTSGTIGLTVVACDDSGRVQPDQLVESITDDTRLVAITHASNVTGAVQPIAEIADRLADQDCKLLVDAAQTFGHLSIDVELMSADLVAAPGHKGGWGPLGTGFLYANPDVQHRLRPTIQGGTGSQSESLEMPADYPQKLEAGNLNLPALAGWLAGLRNRPHIEQTAARLQALTSGLYQQISNLPGLTVHGQPGPLPIASVTTELLTPDELANLLDIEYGIEVRSGFHCAALIHDCLGTTTAGTLRISASPATSDQEIETLIGALTAIVGHFSCE